MLKWVVMFSIDLYFLLWVPVMAEWLGVLVLVGHFRLADLVLVCVGQWMVVPASDMCIDIGSLF